MCTSHSHCGRLFQTFPSGCRNYKQEWPNIQINMQQLYTECNMFNINQKNSHVSSLAAALYDKILYLNLLWQIWEYNLYLQSQTTQQDYYDPQYGALLHSYYTGTYTKVVVLLLWSIAPLLPWSTQAGTPTE